LPENLGMVRELEPSNDKFEGTLEIAGERGGQGLNSRGGFLDGGFFKKHAGSYWKKSWVIGKIGRWEKS